MGRQGRVHRKTGETDITLAVDLDGQGNARLDMPLDFLTHMLTAFARHALVDLEVRARGDLHVDNHHLVEDLGLVLGAAVAEALGDKRGITRFGFASVPMDEALVETSLDISGRPWLSLELPRLPRNRGHFEFADVHEFMKSFAQTAAMTVHITCRRGENQHHVIEALFKSLGRALKQAAAPEPRLGGAIPSTKGVL